MFRLHPPLGKQQLSKVCFYFQRWRLILHQILRFRNSFHSWIDRVQKRKGKWTSLLTTKGSIKSGPARTSGSPELCFCWASISTAGKQLEAYITSPCPSPPLFHASFFPKEEQYGERVFSRRPPRLYQFDMPPESPEETKFMTLISQLCSRSQPNSTLHPMDLDAPNQHPGILGLICLRKSRRCRKPRNTPIWCLNQEPGCIGLSITSLYIYGLPSYANSTYQKVWS